MSPPTSVCKQKSNQNCFTNYTSDDSVVSTHTNHDDLKDIVPDWMLYYFLLVNMWGAGQCVAIFGIGTNILNVITFLRQGFREAVNISLLGLATSDLASLLSLFLVNLCFTPAIAALDLPFYPDQIMYIMVWCHIICTRTTCWITAYITFERCLCIAAPLKVKIIITPRRTVVYMLVLFFISAASVAPIYYTSRSAWLFDPIKNKSLLGITFIENRDNIEDTVFFINNVLPMIAFIVVVTCTMILVRELRKKTKWRQQAAAIDKLGNVSDRDTKVVKMVVFISTVFIICYAPGAVCFIWVFLDEELRLDGLHKNGLFACFSVLFHLESINACANLFIYMRMSSKFKHTFLEMFCVRKIRPMSKPSIEENSVKTN